MPDSKHCISEIRLKKDVPRTLHLKSENSCGYVRFMLPASLVIYQMDVLHKRTKRFREGSVALAAVCRGPPRRSKNKPPGQPRCPKVDVTLPFPPPHCKRKKQRIRKTEGRPPQDARLPRDADGTVLPSVYYEDAGRKRMFRIP